MGGRSLVTTLVFAVFCTAFTESVPFIKKCKSDDSKCAKESAREAIPVFAAGLPEYGVKILDPVSIERIDASSPNLKLILTDVTFKGLKDCIPKKVKRDKAKSKIFLKLECSGILDGQYEMKGQLLILRIEGKGPIHVDLRKLEISLEIDYEEKNDRWNIKEWKHSYELKDKSDVSFGNLFEGNEVMSKAGKELIASSGNEIILGVGPPVVEAVASEVVHDIASFFLHAPVTDLTMD